MVDTLLGMSLDSLRFVWLYEVLRVNVFAFVVVFFDVVFRTKTYFSICADPGHRAPIEVL